VQLLQNVDLDTRRLILESGVFTLDLNGKTVVSARDTMDPYVLYSGGSDVELKIIDSTGTGEGKIESVAGSAVYFKSGKLTIDSGKVAGKTYGVYLNYREASAVINGGTITGDDIGIRLNAGSLEITDGTIYGTRYGVFNTGGTLTVTGGRIDASDAVMYESDAYIYPAGVYVGSASENTAIGGNVSIGGCCGVRVSSNNTTISGGTISGEEYDLLDGSLALTVDKNGTVQAFPAG